VLRKESIRRLEQEIRESEAKIDIPTEANETSESTEDRQSRHSWKARTSSSSAEGSPDQESINKAYPIETVYTKHSKFSFKIKVPLSISWKKSQGRFLLRCPYYFEVETLLHKIQSADNYDPTLKPETNLF